MDKVIKSSATDLHNNYGLTDEEDEKTIEGKDENLLKSVDEVDPKKMESSPNIKKTKTTHNKNHNNKKKKSSKNKKDPNKPQKHVKFSEKVEIVKIECWKMYNLEQTADENFNEVFGAEEERNDNRNNTSNNYSGYNNSSYGDNKMNKDNRKKSYKNSDAKCSCAIF